MVALVMNVFAEYQQKKCFIWR